MLVQNGGAIKALSQSVPFMLGGHGFSSSLLLRKRYNRRSLYIYNK